MCGAATLGRAPDAGPRPSIEPRQAVPRRSSSHVEESHALASSSSLRILTMSASASGSCTLDWRCSSYSAVFVLQDVSRSASIVELFPRGSWASSTWRELDEDLVDHHCNDAAVRSKEADVANRLDDVASVEVGTLWRQRCSSAPILMLRLPSAPFLGSLSHHPDRSDVARPSISEVKSEATPVPLSSSLRS